MIKTFVNKPVKVQAVQWTGDNFKELNEFAGCLYYTYSLYNEYSLIIETPEGNHYVGQGDWIIRGVNGECYPCKPDIFEKTYEEVK